MTNNNSAAERSKTSDEKVAEALLKHSVLTEKTLKNIRHKQKEAALQGHKISLAQLAIKEGLISKEKLKNIFNKNQPTIPKELGGFKIIKKIGEGGMGTVYQANQLSMNRDVALKLLSRKQSANKKFIQHFYREARAAARMSHSNIVTAINVGEDKGIHYFAMELVDGISLRELMKIKGVLPEDYCLHIAKQVTLGLEHATKHNIVHRDIKPDNILLATQNSVNDGTFGSIDDVVKIADMGIARMEDEKLSADDNKPMGTPHYISPEQAKGKGEIDFRADIYSLGATLYHMSTGHTPFTGENALKVVLAHINEPLKSPREHLSSMTTGFSKLIVKMMKKNPNERYNSHQEIIKAIEKLGNRKIPSKKLVVTKNEKKQPIGLYVIILVFIIGGLILKSSLKNESTISYYPTKKTKTNLSEEGLLTVKKSPLMLWLNSLDSKKFGTLSNNGAAAVTELDLRKKLKITNNDIGYLNQLNRLEGLKIKNCQFNDFKKYTGLKKLSRLHLITLPNVNEWVKTLASMKSLTSLTIESCHSINIDSLEQISEMSQLSELHLLNMSNINNRGIIILKNMTQLKSFSLTGSRINNTGLILIKKMKSLKHLDLSLSNIDDKSLEYFAQLKNLNSLTLKRCNISNKGVDVFKKEKPTCEIVTNELSIRENTNKATATIKKEAPRQTLQKINDPIITWLIELNPKKFSALTKDDLANISELDLSESSILLPGDIEKLGELPNLKKIKLQKIQPVKLNALKTLHHLHLVEVHNVDEWVKKITDLTSLTTLTLESCHTLSNTEIEQLSNIETLTNLSITDSRINNDDLKNIMKITNLTHLNLSHSNISDDAIKHIEQLESLISLTINQTKISIEAINAFKNENPTCDVISDK